MSLTVDVASDPTFGPLVQSALKKICPCFSVKVDLTTGVVSLGGTVCVCYCNHRAGCNMLADLVNGTRAIRIQYVGGSSSYKDNLVEWYTHDIPDGDLDVCGKRLNPAWLQLAHEFVHAVQDTTGEGEFAAVRGENQVRLEACLPMREYYSDELVTDFRVGVLDNSNRPEYGCNCSIFRGGISKMVRRGWCALHSMYCFPKPVIKIWKAERPGGAQ